MKELIKKDDNIVMENNRIKNALEKSSEYQELKDKIIRLKELNKAKNIEVVIEGVMTSLATTIACLLPKDCSTPAILITIAEAVGLAAITVDSLITREEVKGIVEKEEDYLEGDLELPKRYKKIK